MKKVLATIFLPVIVYAGVPDETEKIALLVLTKSIGQAVYKQCIVTPPTSPSQIEACTDLYVKKYLPNEALLTLPSVVKPALELSPYANSAYDICRNQTGRVIFSKNIPGMPYCSTVPK